MHTKPLAEYSISNFFSF